MTSFPTSKVPVYVVVAPNKDDVVASLNNAIVTRCVEAIKLRNVFTIALSGGSLASFLSSIDESFQAAGEDPKYDCWNVILADERCVPIDDPDSNLGSLQKQFLSNVPIPAQQIHGIDKSKLDQSTEAIARDYETVVRKVLALSEGFLDLAVLGFGPDGHTCSLFPGHALLHEMVRWVAPINDSPKPPPNRITLTFPVLNFKSRHVILCGAGSSKSPILRQIFSSIQSDNFNATEQATGLKYYRATMVVPSPFPCAMVSPNTGPDIDNTVTWVVDADAVEGLTITD